MRIPQIVWFVLLVGPSLTGFLSGLALSQTKYTIPPQLVRQLEISAVSPDSGLRVVSAGKVTAIPRGTHTSPQISAGEFLLAPTPVRKITVAERPRYMFPVRGVTTNDSGELFDLRPFLEPTTEVLTFLPDGSGYSGKFLVGLEDRRSQSSRAVPGEIWAILQTDGPQLSKSQIKLDHTYAPYEAVTLSGHLQGDSAKISMRIDGWQGGGELDVMIPAAVVDIVVKGPSTLPGLGVGEADYIVEVDQSAGTGSRSIALIAENGSLNASSVDASGVMPGSVNFRSNWLGSASITASGGGLRAAPKDITLVFPTVFLLVSLVGGVVGSVIRALITRQGSGAILVRYFLAGILMGLIVAGLFVLGVNVFSFPLPTQSNPLAIFVISAIGSIALISLFRRWSGVRRVLGHDDSG